MKDTDLKTTRNHPAPPSEPELAKYLYLKIAKARTAIRRGLKNAFAANNGPSDRTIFHCVPSQAVSSLTLPVFPAGPLCAMCAGLSSIWGRSQPDVSGCS